MPAKIKKGDIVEVIVGRSADSKRIAKRNQIRRSLGLEELEPGDKGKQGRVLKVYPKDNKVLVEGINIRKKHVRRTQENTPSGILPQETPISISKVALVDSASGERVRVGFRSETVIRNGREKLEHVRVIRGGSKRGLTTGKDLS